MLFSTILVSVNSLMAVNYYSAKSGDWDSPIWTLNPNDKNSKLIKLPETLSNEDRLIVRHHVKNSKQIVNLGDKIQAPISVENGAKLEIEGNLRLTNYFLSNECKVEIHENLYLDGQSNICGNGDLVIGGNINKSNESSICSNIPVELGYFKALYQEDGIVIEWYSFSIINDLRFELQKSNDGLNFETVKMFNNSSEVESKNYLFKDSSFNPDSDLVYYRLKQLDNTDRHNYSEIITVDLSEITAQIDELTYRFPYNMKITSRD